MFTVPHGPHSEHVKNGWSFREHSNFKFIFYEDLVNDMSSAVASIASFLGKSVTDEEIRKIVEHFQVDNFRRNDSVNGAEFTLTPR